MEALESEAPGGALAGRVALVTGAAQGLGAAIATRLARDGAHVVLTDRDGDAVEQRHDAMRADGLSTSHAKLDVSDPDDVRAAVERIVADHPEITILVNNAGIRRDRTLVRMSDDEWNDVLDVNLRGAFNCCRAVLPHMPSGTGRIVSLSSKIFLGNFGSTNYSASKAGLIGLSRALALEVARQGITVNVVAPGVIQTPGLDVFKADAPEAYAGFMRAVPMAEPGSPEDIAGLVRFFVSDDARYITGQTVFVDGGWSIGAPAW
jgi:3-oxoacyl-[acyl-carrier protein] reductase